MTIEQIDPTMIAAQASRAKGSKFGKASVSGADFGSYMNMFGASAGPVAATAGSMYGNTPAYVALNAAFSGIGQAASVMGGGGGMNAGFSGGVGTASGAPYLAAGMSGGKGSIYGGAGTLDPNGSVIPGTGTGADGMSYGDMIGTMNQNNLQLLELQAMMQNNMQMWNTKSNILSADHRARMAMIEKFTARG